MLFKTHSAAVSLIAAYLVAVIAARAVQVERFKGENKSTRIRKASPNCSASIAKFSRRAKSSSRTPFKKLGPPAHAHDRILKVARTIADLDGVAEIPSRQLSEAIPYRTLDRTYWA